MILALLPLLLTPTFSPAQQAHEFVDLFPDGSLQEWRVVGGDGKFEWDSSTNELHGWSSSDRNTFLLSKRQWSNFVLEVELNIGAAGNSGILFRSHLTTAGGVMGTQVDDRAAFKKGEWNHYRIEARGPWLRTWVNGTACANLIDESGLSGHISFQALDSSNTEMRWRNARIRHLGGESEVAVDRAFLLNGVSSVPAMGTPGTIAVFGRSAFAVLTGGQKNPLAVAAAAHFGKGRVFAIAHNSYFGADVFADASSDAGKLIRNALAWLTPVEEKRSVAFLGNAIAAEAFAELGFTVAANVSINNLTAHDLLVLSGGVQLNATNSAAVRSFVANGGSLMAAICPWGWQQVNAHRGWRLATDLGDNRILVPMGLCFADGYASGGRYEVSIAAAQKAHAGAALDAMLAGEKNVQAHALELAVSSLPQDDTTFMWPLRSALPIIDASNAPHPNQRLSTKEHALERLAVMLDSRKWRDFSAEHITPAPGADHFPGAVAADAKRIALKLNLEANMQGWQSTGLYLAPGETLRAVVQDGSNTKGWSVRIGCHVDHVWHKDNWQRWPEISASWPLTDGGTYASPYGGSVYLVPSESAGALEIQLLGAVAAPIYKRSNPISAEAWQQMKQAPGPWAELVGNFIVLSVPTYAIQDLDDPESTLAYWDELVQSHFEFGAEKMPTRPERFVADAQISAGYMHAGYPIMTWLDVVTPRPGQQPVLLDLEELRSKGNWGYFHELGHNRQKSDWTFGGTGEVTNNLFSLHGGEVMAGIVPWENPWLQNQKKSGAQYLVDGADFNEWKRKPGVALLCYAQIQQEFGWEVFTQVFAEYRDLPSQQRPRNEGEKIQQWVLRMSLATGHDLRPFHQKWGWPLSDALLADPRLADLKPWMPDFHELR